MRDPHIAIGALGPRLLRFFDCLALSVRVPAPLYQWPACRRRGRAIGAAARRIAGGAELIAKRNWSVY